MFARLSHFSKQRYAWLLLLILSLSLEACALFFQYVMNLAPCVMCVYERVALFGIVFAGLLGLINPKNSVIRGAGLALWAYSAYRGLMLAIEHTNYQINPSPFQTCDLFPQFPSWAPLEQWLPQIFHPTGDCSQIVWTFLGFSMPQWLIVVFAINLALCLIFIGVQFIKPKQNHL